MNQDDADIREPVDLFAYDLAAVYDMEAKLVDALDSMSKTVENENLSDGFAVHSTETEGQRRRIEDAFEALGREPTRRADPVVDGLLEARARFDAAVADEELRNLRYLQMAIEIERIEITRYEGLLRTAKAAGLGDDVTEPLAGTLAQEEKTLGKLRALSAGSKLRALWEKWTRT